MNILFWATANVLKSMCACIQTAHKSVHTFLSSNHTVEALIRKQAITKSEKLKKIGCRNIEIINNTRGDIEGKIWERGDWGANSSPGCSLIHDFPGKKVILDEFFCFLKCFSS